MENDTYLPGDLAPGILDRWIGPADWFTPPPGGARSAPGSWTSAVWAGGAYAHNVRLDFRRPEVAHRSVDWARTGLKCSACDGRGEVGNYAQTDRCPHCPIVAGWERPPHDLSPFIPLALGGKVANPDHSAALLVASVRGIVAGVGPVVALWGQVEAHPSDTWARQGWTARRLIAGRGCGFEGIRPDGNPGDRHGFRHAAFLDADGTLQLPVNTRACDAYALAHPRFGVRHAP